MYLPDPFENADVVRSRSRLAWVLYLTAYLVVAFVALSGLVYVSIFWLNFWVSEVFGSTQDVEWSKLCVQPPGLAPPSAKLGLQNASQFLTKEYETHSAELLGGSVRIPTISYDDMVSDPAEEPRFEIFQDLHRYLHKSFPRVSEHSETVNTYGLLYTIEGHDRSAKPVILMAHQDVVPVEKATSNQWKHGPFSGYFDGHSVWGRGSVDTKSSLVAILEATESLLRQHWQPERTVLISFGFDEELDGSRGALPLANTIRERYGAEDSIYMILDEGTSSVTEKDTTFAAVGVTEKGYTDIQIDVKTPGGHSSIPPDHTGIGIISDIITRLEDSHIKQTEYFLAEKDLITDTYSCIARYGEFGNSTAAENERLSLLNPQWLARKLGSQVDSRSLVGTSQAVDIINGGVKINALPEQVTAVVNYRIDVRESVGSVTSQVQKIVTEVADERKLGVVVNGNVVYEPTEYGRIEITNGQSIEPAPVSPYGYDDEQWSILVGSTKHVLGQWFDIDVEAMPVLCVGNTDTWRYQGLSSHVYRYVPTTPNSGFNAHTVNEHVTIEGHIAAVLAYYELLQFF